MRSPQPQEQNSRMSLSFPVSPLQNKTVDSVVITPVIRVCYRHDLKIEVIIKRACINYMWTSKAKDILLQSQKHQNSVCCWKPDVEELGNLNPRLGQ